VVTRVGAVRWVNANRPRSQFQASLTARLVRASWRWISPRRDCTVSEQPAEQWSQTDGVVTTSKGRALKRYDAEVRAPTGQIWITLPEK
jgi:hypothetical protein